MRPTTPRRTVAAALLIALTATAYGQNKTSDKSVDEQARALIATALKHYREAKTYHDEMTAVYELVATSNDDKPINDTSKFTVDLTFGQPNKLALSTEGLQIRCNGEHTWLYIEPLAEYIALPESKKIDLTELEAHLPSGLPPHPILYALVNPDEPFDKLYPMVGPFTKLEKEEFDGRPGTRLYGSFNVANTPLPFEEGDVPLTLWFDAKTGLLGQLTMDLTELSRKRLGLTGEGAASGQAPLKSLEHETATLNFADVKTNVDVPMERFTFTPPPDTKKVETFSEPGMPDPRTLIGKPAPAFTAKDIAGQTIDLEKLHGRVVLLDFWATWCAPCVAAIPQLQKVHEQFKDQPVSIIGINQDSSRTASQVEPFLKEHKVTFNQVRDPAGEIGTKYRVSGIPCSVLIGKDGVVQAVHVGFNPAAPEEYRKQLTEEIGKLLKGEKLAESADK